MNKNKYNFNYVFLVYDIKEERVHKVFKICKKYLSHFQKSVFRGELSPSNQLLLEKELKDITDKNEDFICVLKFINNKSFKP